MKKITMVFMAALVAGCATQPTVSGTTLADSRLFKDTLNQVRIINAALGCTSMDRVTSSVIANPVGEPGHRSWQEKWIVDGCGAAGAFDIRFTEDGAGGAFFGITKT